MFLQFFSRAYRPEKWRNVGIQRFPNLLVSQTLTKTVISIIVHNQKPSSQSTKSTEIYAEYSPTVFRSESFLLLHKLLRALLGMLKYFPKPFRFGYTSLVRMYHKLKSSQYIVRAIDRCSHYPE